MENYFDEMFNAMYGAPATKSVSAAKAAPVAKKDNNQSESEFDYFEAMYGAPAAKSVPTAKAASVTNNQRSSQSNNKKSSQNEKYKDRISNQITKYQTDKKLIESINKLKVASVKNYAHIHANGERDENGRKRYSLIGLTLLDYSSKTTDTVSVNFNLTPVEIRYWLNKVTLGDKSFVLKQEKIIEDAKNDKGRSLAQKIFVSYKDGMNYPWQIIVENGSGIARNSVISPNSYIVEKKVFVNLSDFDMFKFLSKTESFITLWEKAHGVSVICEAERKLANMECL